MDQQPTATPSPASTPRYRRILLLALSLVVLALIPAVYRWRTATPATTTGSPSATPLPALTAGWRYVNAAVSQHVAAAPEDDQRLVSCGSRADRTRFSASQDGGRHWSAAVVVGGGDECQISAASARLVAIVTTTCARCSVSAPWALFISRDAGATWLPIAGPDGLDTFGGLLAWQGDTLFTSLNDSFVAPPRQHLFAAWTPTAGLQPRDAGLLADGIANLWWLGSAAGAVIIQCAFTQTGTRPPPPPNTCAFRSTDGGHTWRRIAATDILSAPLMATATTLVAFGRSAVDISADGGATWQPLAALPAGMIVAPSPNFVSDTPAAFLAGDRLFVGLQDATYPMTIATLPTLAASAWRTVAPLCASCLFQAATAGPGNAGVTLWALSFDTTVSGGEGSLVALTVA